MKLGESLVVHNNKNYYDEHDRLGMRIVKYRKSLQRIREFFIRSFEQISNLTKNIMRQEFLQ